MRKIRGLCIFLGVVMIISAIGLTGYNLWDDYRAAYESDLMLQYIHGAIDTEQPEVPDYMLNPYMDMPTVEMNGYLYIGVVSVPKLELMLPVMDSWSYQQLKISPCRYVGSAYLNNMIIAAHNYNSHFGRLKNLEPGDTVTFTDMANNQFFYTVVEIETLHRTAVEEMESGGWDLTLFTCTPGGRTRVTVRCRLAEEQSADN